MCIDPAGSGELTAAHLKWTLKSGINGMNSPLIVGDYLYRISSTLRCYRLATGEEVWNHRLSGDFNPSPISTADGLIYYASAGMSWVIKAGPAYEQLAANDLGEPSSCSPAVANGRIFLKSDAHLFCIGAK
jgi:outer membrane protein assembly factor BamB